MTDEHPAPGSPYRQPAPPRAGRIPRETYGVVALASAVLAGWFLFRYSGPYRIVADAMVSVFHTNVVAVSYFATLALIVALPSVAVYAAERRFGTRETSFTPIYRNLDRALDLPAGKLLLVGLTLFAVGGWFAGRDLATGPLTSLSVRALEAGAPLPGRYVELTDGTVDTDANISFRANSQVYRYLPVTDHAEQPVLFLRVAEASQVRDGEGRIRGIVEPDAMEGELQGQLRERGLLGERHYVLGVGRVPDPEVGLWIAAAGLVATMAALLWLRGSAFAPRRVR